MELVTVRLRIALREYCKAYLTVRPIKEAFSASGLQQGKIDPERLQNISGERSTVVEEYYASIDWTSKKDVQKFLNTLTLLFQLYPEASSLKNICEEEGFVVNGDTVSFKPEGGVNANVKNLIFATIGYKPDILLLDAVSNDIKVTGDERNRLVYDRPISDHGLYWKDLVEWWHDTHETNTSEADLYKRLYDSLESPPEKLLFETYKESILKKMGSEIPALIPQVYLHYDPYTTKQLGGEKRLIRQRMDFLMLFSNHRRVVVEVDGIQHYSKKDQNSQNIAKPEMYAEMVSEDRRLKLLGYEVYRFGGYELYSAKGKNIVEDFFDSLLNKRE